MNQSLDCNKLVALKVAYGLCLAFERGLPNRIAFETLLFTFAGLSQSGKESLALRRNSEHREPPNEFSVSLHHHHHFTQNGSEKSLMGAKCDTGSLSDQLACKTVELDEEASTKFVWALNRLAFPLPMCRFADEASQAGASAATAPEAAGH